MYSIDLFMKLNPFSAKKTSDVSLAKDTKKAQTEKNTKSKEDKRNDGEKLAIKNVQEAVPEYQTIKATADLDRTFISKDKKEEKRLAASAKKVLKKINFDGKMPEYQFIEGHIAASGADPIAGSAKLVVNMSGQVAVNRFFKTGITTKLFGWIPRLFGGANKSIGYKWLKGNHGFNLYDPKSKHSHLEDPNRVQEMLKSGRYAVSVVYKADPNGGFTKEPEAIALIDRMGQALDDVKENIKNAPKEVRERMEETSKRFTEEKLHTFCMLNTVMINPKSEANYETGNKSLFYRETLLTALLESFEKHTSFIIPSEIFAPKDAKTDKYQYDAIDELHFLDLDAKKGVIGDFKTKATVARNLDLYPDSLPAQDLTDLMMMAMISEHVKNPSKLNKPLQNKLNEMLGKIASANKKAFDDLNTRLAA